MKDLRFGVEVEMAGASVPRAAQVVNAYFQGEFDHLGRSWTVDADGSVPDGFELRSPPLFFADLYTLEALFHLLRSAGAHRSSDSAGIHVHVDVRAFSVAQLINLLFLYSQFEYLLYDALDVHPRRMLQYCKPVGEFARRISESGVRSLHEFREIWYDGFAADSQEDSRYFNLNFHSYFVRGTVEFRAFASTNQAEKLRSFIVVATSFASAARQETGVVFEPPLRPRTYEDADAALRRMTALLGLDSVEHRPVVETLRDNLKRNRPGRDRARRTQVVFKAEPLSFDGGSFREVLEEMLDNGFFRLQSVRKFLRAKTTDKASGGPTSSEGRGEAFCRGVVERLEAEGFGQITTRDHGPVN